METKKFPIIVNSFHYDLLQKDDQASQDVQVAMRTVQPNDDRLKGTEKDGNFFEIMVPFDVTVENNGFRISGSISRVVQVLNYFGEASDLPPEELEKLSRPLVEYIETLTYQVTSVALNEGVSLNFQASGEPETKDDAK
ncbi:DUF1149 family protein [Schleiferilactobacillus harbinensis]|jgi:hypothetical protein|uniref:DUF1149 family protein n=2 Tax=Schleiferilactobacillus harbinensis TaxID=304207 RepID=A0A510TUV1_9LACO|nr:DUF1149 family protein [Schleiferilactobacillus harbinensis]KRM29288.1 hypothetical protein FC91_GL000865 [Schleiferilactobacillus harbinensis DSM 16991]MCI1687404.1 DUF1149 family protein [Schleiferilactobacillus harbinensis]MCI1782508.1 DUF1149 family protein [Schleiferilactobacillus harbinensis]MCI1850622.1 DUF1149 family protein [Schleiferilactobacillus harbinensis]MCT2907884.1 DUF1149 family protein [Schleiferilactobacillus harbinensis]